MKCKWIEDHECKIESPRTGGYGEGDGVRYHGRFIVNGNNFKYLNYKISIEVI